MPIICKDILHSWTMLFKFKKLCVLVLPHILLSVSDLTYDMKLFKLCVFEDQSFFKCAGEF